MADTIAAAIVTIRMGFFQLKIKSIKPDTFTSGGLLELFVILYTV